MLDDKNKKFISNLVNQICSTFGCTGTVPEAGSVQPGALEVIGDALCEGHWSNGVAVGSGLFQIANSIGNLAEAVEKVADELHQMNDK